MKIQIKRKLNLKLKKTTKLEKLKKSVQFFAMRIQLISNNLKKFFICSEKQVRTNHQNLDIKEQVMSILPLETLLNSIGNLKKSFIK